MITPDPTTRPQPVLDAAKIAAALTGLVGGVLTVLAAFGVTVPNPEELTRAVVAAATGLLTLLSVAATLWAALRARGRVTPLEDPVTQHGVPLVPDEPGQHAAPEVPGDHT